MDVSVIIVNWNTRSILRDCLSSVFKQTQGIEFEVIVIDNGSSDSSVQMVETEFSQVNIIANTENRGFAAANNQGMAVAKGRYVLLLNSDTVILDDVIKKTVLFADTHREVAVVGCRVLNADRTLQQTCFMFPSVLNMLLATTCLYKLFPRNRFFGRERMTWWNRDSVSEVDVATGCFMLVRRQAIEKIGLMDERFFVYGEETDWCYRFKKSGWKIMFTPDGQIIHYGGQTTKQMARKFRLQLHGSELIFMKLHRSKLTFLFARFLTASFLILRVPYWLAVAALRKHKRKLSIQTTKTYLLGSFYCLADWKKLLMNKNAVKDKL
jgi:GT2 family glycosyltransferase